MKTSKNTLILDYNALKNVTDAHKTLGHKIICTIGSWDMLHVGHLRYLMRAKAQGDVLVVGADSDRGIKIYKNELRPIIPEDERMEMLQYQDCVDYVTLVDDIDEKGRWEYGLVNIIRPHMFITTPDSYPENQINDIKQYVEEIVVIPRQAENTSSTSIVENTVKKHLETMLLDLKKKNGS